MAGRSSVLLLGFCLFLLVDTSDELVNELISSDNMRCGQSRKCPKWMYCDDNSDRCQPCTLCGSGGNPEYNSCKQWPTHCLKDFYSRPVFCPKLSVSQHGNLSCDYNLTLGTTCHVTCPGSTQQTIRCEWVSNNYSDGSWYLIGKNASPRQQWNASDYCVVTATKTVVLPDRPVDHGITPKQSSQTTAKQYIIQDAPVITDSIVVQTDRPIIDRSTKTQTLAGLLVVLILVSIVAVVLAVSVLVLVRRFRRDRHQQGKFEPRQKCAYRNVPGAGTGDAYKSAAKTKTDFEDGLSHPEERSSITPTTHLPSETHITDIDIYSEPAGQRKFTSGTEDTTCNVENIPTENTWQSSNDILTTTSGIGTSVLYHDPEDDFWNATRASVTMAAYPFTGSNNTHRPSPELESPGNSDGTGTPLAMVWESQESDTTSPKILEHFPVVHNDSFGEVPSTHIQISNDNEQAADCVDHNRLGEPQEDTSGWLPDPNPQLPDDENVLKVRQQQQHQQPQPQQQLQELQQLQLQQPRQVQTRSYQENSSPESIESPCGFDWT